MSPAEAKLLEIMRADASAQRASRDAQELGARNSDKPAPRVAGPRTRVRTGPERDARIAAVLRCHRAGMLPYQIRHELGLTRGTVSGILDRYAGK